VMSRAKGEQPADGVGGSEGRSELRECGPTQRGKKSCMKIGGRCKEQATMPYNAQFCSLSLPNQSGCLPAPSSERAPQGPAFVATQGRRAGGQTGIPHAPRSYGTTRLTRAIQPCCTFYRISRLGTQGQRSIRARDPHLPVHLHRARTGRNVDESGSRRAGALAVDGLWDGKSGSPAGQAPGGRGDGPGGEPDRMSCGL
jgi:hypothetical protein